MLLLRLKGNPVPQTRMDEKADRVEIWPTIKVDDEDLDALNELKALMSQRINKTSTIPDQVPLESDLGGIYLIFVVLKFLTNAIY